MKELFKNLKFTWSFSKKLKWKLIKYILCNLFSVFISIVVPIISANIIVNLTSSKFSQLIYMAIILFFVEILRNIVNFFSRYYSQIIYRESFIAIQTTLGREILKIQNDSIDMNGSGVFIQRLTGDTSKLADIFNILNMYLTNIITDIGIFTAVFIINKWAFLYLIISMIIMYLIERVRVRLFNEKDKAFRKENEKVSSFVGELVRGIRDIKMLNAEDNFVNELHSKVTQLNIKKYEMGKINRNYIFLRGSVNDLSDLGMIILLVFLIVNGDLMIANALVIHNYMYRVTSLIYYFGALLDGVKDFNLSSSRVFSIITGSEFKKEEFGNKHIEKINGDFEFKNVSFSYSEDGNKILEDLNFKVKANETVAFIGKSGAGKTTIFNLLCKMYDADSGEITIDGVNIKELDKESIRGNITVISQNPYIFNLSIKDNLRLVKENLTEDEMIEACKMACLDDFIESLPDKYDTIVGESGVTLSGGQKQRLAIARAFVQKTEIILFDEATSALDNETQDKIQKAIDNLKRDYTILIIAHRLSTVMNSDRILILDDKMIVSEGTHKELLKKNNIYKKLYKKELN